MIDYSNIRKGNHCIIWTRVSSKYQEDNGGSLDTQKELCEEYAKTHNLAVTKYFGGQHESAKTPGKLVTEMTTYVKKEYRGRYGLDFGIRPLFKNRLAGYKDAGGYAYFGNHCDCREIWHGHKDKRGDDDGSTDAFDGTVG